jgi:hypothetical protein
LALTFSSLVDDGAVFHLNGIPVQRLRMPSETVLYDTLASSRPPSGDATGFDVFTLAGDALTNIVPGENVLAVEVHQASLTSSDVVLGCAVNALVTNVPIAIVRQPHSQTVGPGANAVFGVLAVGEPPLAYQWRKDGTELSDGGRFSGTTTAVLTITDVQPGHEGSYSVVVSNAYGIATSAAARLTVLPLLSLANVWNHNQSGADLGTAWREMGYDDSGWPQGVGVLAFETNPVVVPLIHTPLSLVNPAGQRIITYYFRTRFTLTNDPAMVYLAFSNLVDDGAIVYLNGAELYRLNMPSGSINARTLAPSAATEGAFVARLLVSTNLQQGDNVLSVEVHQNSTNSSDIVFGLSLSANPLDAGSAVVLTPPQSQTVNWGDSATFTARIAGEPPLLYQWRFNGTDIPGANNPVLVLTDVTVAHRGNYDLRVQNLFGSATSTAATLRVNRIPSSPVWAPEDGVILVDSLWTVPSNSVLTIKAGTVVKFLNPSAGLYVRGTLQAQGTPAEPVVFTSFKDDTAGADTNGDGTNSTPARADWAGLYFPSSGLCTLENVRIRYAYYAVNANYQTANVALWSAILQTNNYGVYVYQPYAQVEAQNCLIEGNAYNGIFARADSRLTFRNCTIVGNGFLGSGMTRAGIHVAAPQLTLENCIVAFNANGLHHDSDPPALTVQYCDFFNPGGQEIIWNSDPGRPQLNQNGNTTADPLFLDRAAGNYELADSSPAIDAARGSSAPATDILGRPRYDDLGRPNRGFGSPSYVDIGAFERQQDSPAPDLAVTHVSEPVSANGAPLRDLTTAGGASPRLKALQQGESVSINWTVSNVGRQEAVGTWQDRVILT